MEERIVLDAAAAAVIYLNAQATGTVHDGSSWAHAYTSLQDALTKAAATSGADQFWVAKGTYSTNITFALPDNVSIYGGFKGNKTSLKRNISDNTTILKDTAGNSVITLNHATATLDGVVIKNQTITGNGAAINSSNQSILILSNDILTIILPQMVELSIQITPP